MELTIKLNKKNAKLLESTLYRAYSMPRERKIYKDGAIDCTYIQTEQEKNKMRILSVMIKKQIDKNL